MSAFDPDDSLDEVNRPAPDPDKRPDPAKLRGYWGDPADRPPRPVWDPSVAEPLFADPPTTIADPAEFENLPDIDGGDKPGLRKVAHGQQRHAEQRRIGPRSDAAPVGMPGGVDRTDADGSVLDHVLAILLSVVGGAVAAGVALALTLRLRPRLHGAGSSITWSTELMLLLIALVTLGGVFMFFGSLVGMAAPRAWGWSALVAWVPLGILAFKAVTLLRPELSARLSELPAIATLIGRLPDVSLPIEASSGLTVCMLQLAILGGRWGASSNARASRVSVVPEAGETSKPSAPHEAGSPAPTAEPSAHQWMSPQPDGARSTREAGAEPRDERRPVGSKGYW